MTREEAVEALTRLEISNFRSGKSYITEAFVMAIEALRTEPCEDCISRQCVLDIVEINRNSYDGNDAVVWIERQIKELSSVQPKSEDSKFLEFLFNVINPNEMEHYITMYHCKEEKVKHEQG